MAINLHDRYAKKIEKYFTTASYIKGALSNEYKSDAQNVKTIKVSTIQTVPMVDYNRALTDGSRYGPMHEVEDIVQELTMTQDKAFKLSIDKGNLLDQQRIKEAGRVMRLQVDERMIPDFDTYCFNKLARSAGTIFAGPKPSKTNITDRIDAGVRVLDDGEVPQENRTLYIGNEMFMFLKQSGATIFDPTVVKQAWVKGKVGEYNGMNVVKVPAGRWPVGVNFMLVYKNSAVAPEKIDETRVKDDSEFVSGSILLGRHYFDLFVLGAKAIGIYTDVDSAAVQVTATPTINASTGALASTTSGAVVYYTVDGSDPRYFNRAKAGGTAAEAVAGNVIKAYAVAPGYYPSAVATAVKE